MIGIGQILVIALLIAAFYYGSRWAKNRDIAKRQEGDSDGPVERMARTVFRDGRPDGRSGGQAGESGRTGAVDELVQCQACGTFRPRDFSGCDQPNCPFSARKR